MKKYNRFRTRTPPTPKTSRGDKNGKKISAGMKLGVLNEYQSNGNLLQSTQLNATGTLKESFFSERCWDEVHPGPPWRDGGNFAKVKILLPSSGTMGYGTYTSRGNPAFTGKARVEYLGGFAMSGFNPDGLPYEDYLEIGPEGPWQVQNFPSLTSYELKAWDMLRPRIEKASVPQFLWELRELPKQLETSARGFKDLWHTVGGREDRVAMAGNAADHFLNHNFGWVPFINDLTKFYETYERSEEYINDLYRRNGTWTNRRAQVEETFDDHVLYRDYVSLAMPGIGDPRIFRIQQSPQGDIFSAQTEARVRNSKRVWAEGKFYQYRPEFDLDLITKFPSDWTKTRQLLQLYGIRINPAVLYKVTPWTWLIDWFIGVGRNIEIFSNSIFDAVAAKYAYLMCTTARQVAITSSLYFWSGTVNLTRLYTVDCKVRAEMGSPYGFNLGWDKLSPKQLAILTAIGIKQKDYSGKGR